ncbi:hypothetical protein EYF80_064313 [Liparis tanakae]|uniref:Uncharacterized protein n=1 Tax=Liparis tanakae TaxID=230148 RepID=A0A4Z2E9L5_9TELE|nr:hypothetical protein EYF80_064313 [Liparis tanakae]
MQKRSIPEQKHRSRNTERPRAAPSGPERPRAAPSEDGRMKRENKSFLCFLLPNVPAPRMSLPRVARSHETAAEPQRPLPAIWRKLTSAPSNSPESPGDGGG